MAATAACAGERWAAGCELAVRLALSHVVAPVIPSVEGMRAQDQCAEPDSWSPITPTMTRLIEMILSVETTSPRKIIP